MTSYFYSATTNAFYPIEHRDDYENSGSWPLDAIEVEDNIYDVFAAKEPPEGKIRAAGENGMPVWVDIPPLTHDALVALAHNMKIQRISEAKAIIDPLQDAADLGMATTKEHENLIEWKKYRVELTRIDVNAAPDIAWPEQPS